MKGSVRLRVDPGLDATVGAVACQLIAPETGETHGVVVTGSYGTPVELPTGTYVARSSVPGGDEIIQTVEVTEGGTTKVTIRSRATLTSPVRGGDESGVASAAVAPPESGSSDVARDPQQASAPTGSRARAKVERRIAGYTAGWHTGDLEEYPDVDLTPEREGESTRVWLQLWKDDEAVEWDARVIARGPGFATLELPSAAHRPHFLQVGGEATAWRFVAITPSEMPRVTITAAARDAGEGSFHDGVSVAVSSGDAEVDALIAYLVEGRLDLARIMGPGALTRAQEMFQSKKQNPAGAAAAGYYLLRVQEQDTVAAWARNFAEWFPWLPDAQVIHAGQLLRRPGVPERDLALRRLLTASSASPPHYSEGLQLLYQGLEMYRAVDPASDEIANGLQRVREFAAASDFSSAATTFWGRSPNHPVTTRVAGTSAGDFVAVIDLSDS